MKNKLKACAIIAVITVIGLITMVSARSYEPITAYVAQFGMLINGEERVLENPIVTINDRTYIPLREIGEVLGVDVEWDGENRKIIINSPQMPESHDKEIDTLYEIEQDDDKEDRDTLYVFEQNGLWGYKDAAGNVIIEPQFAVANIFSEGLAFIVGTNPEERGYIDLSGNLVIPLPEGRFPSGFSQGFAQIVMREWDFGNEYIHGLVHRNRGPQGPFIFIDRTGKDVFGMEFYSALPFEENGLAIVTMLDGTEALIDRQGNIKYEHQHWYRDNGFMKIVLLNGTNMYLDRQGNIVDESAWELATQK